MSDVYSDLFAHPRARAFVLAGLIGRLPMSMLGIGTILLVERHTGSYGIASAVSATMLISQGVTAPRIGRWADRFGQRAVLRPLIAIHVVALATLVSLASLSAPIGTWFVAGIAAGGSFPPIGSLVRARWAALLDTRPARQAAFSLESAIDELVYIAGPLIVSGLVTLWFVGAGLLAAAALTAAGGLAFAAQRVTEPPVGDSERGVGIGGVQRRGLWALAALGAVLGTVIGAIEVSVVAFADDQGHAGLGGVYIGVFSVGSVVSGLAYGTRTWRVGLLRRLLLAVVAVVLGAIPLALSPNLGVMFGCVLLAGCGFAPALIIVYELIDDLLPEDALTEGFAWLQTALGSGLAMGVAFAGVAIEAGGSRSGLVLPVVSGAIALGVVALGRRVLVTAVEATTAQRTARHESAEDGPAEELADDLTEDLTAAPTGAMM